MSTTSTTKSYRAYDTATGWRGPIRSRWLDAHNDAGAHNAGCRSQGGRGHARVIARDPEKGFV